MLEERRLAVLRAIVEDYVSTHEPVGSKALVERHNLGVSPATIRNDMAALEDEGFIAQPHTSAGRVPTDLGYRLFVDRLSGVKPLSPPERRAIHQFLDEAVDLDDVMSRTVRLLAQITRQVALVQYPSLQRSSIRHVELVSLSTTRLILVIIVDTGRVEQRVIECPMPVSEEVIGDLRSRLIVALAGKPFSSVADAVTGFEDAFAEALSYFPRPDEYRLGPDDYLDQIRKIKAAVKVPVIGSLNGTTPAGWLQYAKLIAEAGADALELNLYYLATSAWETGEQVERRTLDAVKAVMTGAHAVQVVSGILQQGPDVIRRIREGMTQWLEEHEYDSLEQMRGSMNLLRCPDASMFERANYIRILQGYKV